MDPRERFSDAHSALQAALTGHQAGIWTALPCIVETVNLQAATLTATPAIQAMVKDYLGNPSLVTLPTLQDVPIVFQRGGGYAVTFPVQPGDECLVVFASRNIDTWWQSGGIQPPLTARFHDLSDGFAITGPWSQATVMKGISATTARFTTEDGLEYVELDRNGGIVNVAAGTRITMTAPVVVINAANSVAINTPAIVAAATTGSTSMVVQGNGSFTGDVTSTGTGVTLNTHVHVGVQTGAGTTGLPKG